MLYYIYLYYIFALKENFSCRKIPRIGSWRPWDRKLTDYFFPKTVILQIISYTTRSLCWNHAAVYFGIGNVSDGGGSAGCERCVCPGRQSPRRERDKNFILCSQHILNY